MAAKELNISHKITDGEGGEIPSSLSKNNRLPSPKFICAKLGKRVKPYPIELLTFNPVDAADCKTQVHKIANSEKIVLSEAFIIWKNILIDYFGHCRYENIESLISAGNRAIRENNKK